MHIHTPTHPHTHTQAGRQAMPYNNCLFMIVSVAGRFSNKPNRTKRVYATILKYLKKETDNIKATATNAFVFNARAPFQCLHTKYAPFEAHNAENKKADKLILCERIRYGTKRNRTE